MGDFVRVEVVLRVELERKPSEQPVLDFGILEFDAFSLNKNAKHGLDDGGVAAWHARFMGAGRGTGKTEDGFGGRDGARSVQQFGLHYRR